MGSYNTMHMHDHSFWACEIANQDGCHRDRSSLFVWTTARYFYVCILSFCVILYTVSNRPKEAVLLEP